MTGWPLVSFEELYSIPSRNGLSRPARVRGSGFKMINMGELFANDIIGEIEMELVPMNEKELRNMLVQRGDLLFARQSLVFSGAGKCSFVKSASEPTTFESHIIRVRLKQDRADPLFYYYYFRSPISGMRSIVTQGVQAGIRGNDLKKLPVHMPDLETQRRIAAILGAYDDLIEVNRRRVAVLEEMARGLFEEWFVRFRFPGHENVPIVDTPDGPLPEGWRIVAISETYDGLYDGPHATPPASDSGPVFLGLKNITETGQLDLSTVRHIAETDFGRWTKRVTPEPGDIVFTYEATLNRYALIPRGFRGCLGRRLALVRSKSRPGMNRYLFLHFFTEGWRNVVAGNTLSGATVDRIPLTKFPEFPITLPTADLLGRFDRVAQQLLADMDVLRKANEVLAASRDLLLPRLISGQLSVEAAERKLENAA